MIAPLKRLAETVAVGAGLPRFGRRLRRREALILAFHNVISDEVPPAGDRSLHLSLSRFRAYLDELVAHHDVVALQALMREPDNGIRRPRVAITFDDAYRGAVTDGVRELARRGLPATIFVSPAFVGDGEFWWDAAASALHPHRFAELRRYALTELRGEHDAICQWASENGVSLCAMPAGSRVATVEELHVAAGNPGITFGTHTWSHPNLTALDAERVREELQRSREWLRGRFESTIDWLSYPYGLTSPAVERLAAEAGFEAALLIEGGWMKLPLQRRYAAPRLNIPSGLSPRGFVLRAAGF
jgi:peptidoglycan/xylan/chitin deacetylase (PgdA/CDA1 family)